MDISLELVLVTYCTDSSPHPCIEHDARQRSIEDTTPEVQGVEVGARRKTEPRQGATTLGGLARRSVRAHLFTFTRGWHVGAQRRARSPRLCTGLMPAPRPHAHRTIECPRLHRRCSCCPHSQVRDPLPDRPGRPCPCPRRHIALRREPTFSGAGQISLG